jgi:PPOX class probable F420-dependent enzyme
MGLSDEKYMRLTTFKRDGTPVSSPVWLVPLEGDKVGFWTSSGSGKAKRLGHTQHVTVQPSDGRGRVKPGTQPIDANALVVRGAEFDAISAKIKAKYGFMTKLTPVLAGIVGVIKRKRMPYGDIGVVVTPTS